MLMLLDYREDFARSMIWPSYDMVDVMEWFPAGLVVVVIGLLCSTVLSSGSNRLNTNGCDLEMPIFESVKAGSKIWVPLPGKRGQGEVMRLEPGHRLQLKHNPLCVS
jgi:hypothetical protein